MERDKNIDLLKLQFTDLSGQSKMIEVTGGHIDRVLREGAVINRFSLEGLDRKNWDAGRVKKLIQEEPDGTELYLKPDLPTLRMLGWESGADDVASVICDVCQKDGSPAWADSRSAFRAVLEKAEEQGIQVDFDFQCEFYLFHTDDEARPTTVTHEVAGYYDAGSIDLAENIRTEIMLGLEEAGMEVESGHHGATPGQHCLVLPSRRGIEAADYLGLFRNAVKRIAKRHGLHASFMPKPNRSGDGSGLHVGVTLNVGTERDAEETLRCFRAGVLRHLRELTIFTNPLVNSYKRLAAARKPLFQPEFPAAVWETGSDKAVRPVKEKNGRHRLEVLYPDPSVNPYLALGAIVAAGLSGLSEGDILGPDEEEPIFPETLGEAICEFEKSQFVRNVFDKRLCDRYLESRKEDWGRFSSYVTDWEIKEYLFRL